MAASCLPSSSYQRRPFFFATKPHGYSHLPCRLAPFPRRPRTLPMAFQRSDFNGFAKKVASGEALRDAWRSANDGFEQILYESRIAAERLNRRYSISTRVAEVARSAKDRALELDAEFGVTRRWRSFSIDFTRNLPRYRKGLQGFLATPLGKSTSILFFLWFALSGWLFRILFFATWVLPFAAPLLIGVVANNFAIRGNCPACRKEFMGSKGQVIRCGGCGNIVWQPKDDFSDRGGGRGRSGNDGRSSNFDSNIIDIEIDDKRR